MRIDVNSMAAAKTQLEDWVVCEFESGKGSDIASNADYSAIYSSATLNSAPGPFMVDAGNSTTVGQISVDGEFDFITLDVVAGETYLVNVRGSGVDPLEDTVLVLFDEAGEFVGQDDDGGQATNSMFTFTAAATGAYTLAVGGFPDSRNLTGEYTVDSRVMGEDEAPFTFEDAALLDLGTSFGFIENSTTDGDTYQIELTAGSLYTFQVDGGADYATNYLNLPQGELDTIIALYDSDGNLIALNDDTAFSQGDVGSSVSLFVEESGTYYLDVIAYDNLTTGDPQIGGYTITAQDLDPADFDPLDAINWVNADNVSYVDVDGTPTAYVYFAQPGESFGELADNGVDPLPSFGWNNWEQQQLMLALEEFEHILGVNYEVTTDVNQATFRVITTESEQYGAYFYPQDPAYGDAQGIGAFNVLSGGWSFDQQQSLERGGFAFAVILHEFGHAHGLAHPHDRGGGSDVMLGVAGSGSLGIYDLNQGVYTVMSYNDAYPAGPNGPSPFTAAGVDNGWSATLSAFDIAVLQQRYGVHDYATGNDVYRLTDNEDDAFYETIWDSGGVDTISYSGGEDAQIDLLAATLDYSPTGGGVVSFVDGIHGGYTIANGAVIENASGGRGNDTLLGNDVANLLTGSNGDDTLIGRGGNDTLSGGNGIDDLSGGDGNDLLEGGNSSDLLSGDAGDDVLEGGNSSDTLIGGDGNDTLDGGNSSDILMGGAGNDTLDGGNSADLLNGGAGDDVLDGGNSQDIYVFTDAGTDTIVDYESREEIDLTGLTGVDSGDVTIDGDTIFVDLAGDDDLTIFVQGDTVTMGDILFAPSAAANSNAFSDQYTAMVA